MAVTQQVIQRACKRRRLSMNGSEKVLVKRLKDAGYSGVQIVTKLAEEFATDGVVSRGPNEGLQARERQPNWSPSELARLCHVIADPRHATAVAALHQRFENRGELERGLHDPWSLEFH